MPVSIRSVSIEGTSIWSFCEKTPAIRSHNDGAAAIDSSTPPSSGRGFMIFELLHELRAIDFSVGVFGSEPKASQWVGSMYEGTRRLNSLRNMSGAIVYP